MTTKWAALVTGLILIISPWAFGFSDISLAKWCNVLIGLALALTNLWMIFEQSPPALLAAAFAEPPELQASAMPASPSSKRRFSKTTVEKSIK